MHCARRVSSPERDGGRKLALDCEIVAGRNNLSTGERQIIALATSAIGTAQLTLRNLRLPLVDYKTDAVIQTSLRELPSDTTPLVVAHRLQSVMDANISFRELTPCQMVLDAGRIVEFDRPKVLLQNKQDMLRALVDQSGVKEDGGSLT
ncbi:hypothetical protein B0H19DRAFT_950623 [Mycena capillaripes]|nr:hypothetical protein B0H19DRAFT_950623 [Mycena capillaripes]